MSPAISYKAWQLIRKPDRGAGKSDKHTYSEFSFYNLMAEHYGQWSLDRLC
jgi:hypothetical protein